MVWWRTAGESGRGGEWGRRKGQAGRSRRGGAGGRAASIPSLQPPGFAFYYCYVNNN